MRNKKPKSYSRNYEKSRNYTSFFTEESLDQRVEEINESIHLEEASFHESKDPHENAKKIKEPPKTEFSSIQQVKAFVKKKSRRQEIYNSEESFEMEEEQNRIDLPFQEDELYSNILMEFLPKLKQEIVANKVQRRRSDITVNASVKG